MAYDGKVLRQATLRFDEDKQRRQEQQRQRQQQVYQQCPELEDAVENAREAAYNWISLELEEEGDLPAQTHIDDMSLPEGSMVKQIMVRIKLLPDND